MIQLPNEIIDKILLYDFTFLATKFCNKKFVQQNITYLLIGHLIIVILIQQR